MEVGDLFFVMIGAAMFSILGVFLIYLGAREIKMWRAVKDIPSSTTMDLEQGPVEVQGYVKCIPGEEITSPITQTPCAMYEVKVDERRSRKNRQYWKTIDKNSYKGDFLVADEDGLVKVHPDGADIDMVESYNWGSQIFQDTPEWIVRYLENRGVGFKGAMGIMKKTIRVREEVLPADHPIYVLGQAVQWRMEDILEKDMFVSPYTIIKDEFLVVSTKSEKKVSQDKLTGGIVKSLVGASILLIGLFGMIAVVLV